MGIKKNVLKGEKEARIVVGVVLIPLGLFLAGVWKPLFVVIGISLILTAFFGY